MARRPLTIDQTVTEQFASVDPTMPFRIRDTRAFPAIVTETAVVTPTPPALPVPPVRKAVVTARPRRREMTWTQVWEREIHSRDFKIYLGILGVISALVFATIMVMNEPPTPSPRAAGHHDIASPRRHRSVRTQDAPRPSHRLSTVLKAPIPAVTPTHPAPKPHRRRQASSKPTSSPSRTTSPSPIPSKTPKDPPSSSVSPTTSNTAKSSTPTPTKGADSPTPASPVTVSPG